MQRALHSMHIGRQDEAESWLRAAIDEDSELSQAWTALGFLMANMEGMEQQACRAYIRALELDRNEPMTWAALASTLHEIGQIPDAEAAYRQALVRDPEHDISLLGLAQMLRGIDGRGGEALKILRDMLRRKPDVAPAWDLLGAIMEEDIGDLDEAETAYRRSISIDPTDHRIWDRLGRMLEHKIGDRWAAYRLYNESVKFDCSFAFRSLRLTVGLTVRALVLPPILSVFCTTAADRAQKRNRYRAMRFWARLGRIVWPGHTRPLCQLGLAAQYGFADYDRAEIAFRKAIDKEPRYEWPWRLLGILLFDVRGDHDEAATVLQRATELDPFNSDCWSLLGRCYERRGELDKAEGAIRRAIDVDEGNPSPWVYLGEHFSVRRGNPGEAIRYYEQALRVNPVYTDAWVCKGIALMSGLKNYAEAENCFRRAIELKPDAPNAWRCLGTVLYKHLDRPDEAEECLRKAIALEADNWSAEVHLATLLFKTKGRFEEAEARLRALLGRRVYLAHALPALLSLYAAKGDVDGGRAIAENTLLERPSDFDTLHHLAWVVHDERLEALYGAAEQWARQAVALQPGVIPILHTLTEILFDQGRTEEALTEAEPVYEAVLARRFPASDIRKSLANAAAEGNERAVSWLEKIETHCD